MLKEITINEFFYALKILENNLHIKAKAIKVGDSVLTTILEQPGFISRLDYKDCGITPIYCNEVGMFAGLRIVPDDSLKDWMFTIVIP